MDVDEIPRLHKVMSKCLEQSREELHEVEGRLRRCPVTSHSGAVARFQSYRRKMEAKEFNLPKAIRKLKHSRMDTEGELPPARGTFRDEALRGTTPPTRAPSLLPAYLYASPPRA